MALNSIMSRTSDSSRTDYNSDMAPNSPDTVESMEEWSSDNSSRKRSYSEGQTPHTKKREKVDEESPRGEFHLRFLIKSQYCSRVLGHGARRLQDLKDKAAKRRGPLEAWISRPTNAEYRVMHTVGTPETVSKFVGLVARVILDENDEPSNAKSRPFTLLVLMPHGMMGRLIGSRMSNFKDIERQSAAHLSADHSKLPNSDDRLVYVAGVADALHIAVYHLGVNYLRDSQSRKPLSNPFEPTEGVHFEIRDVNGLRDRIPRKPSSHSLNHKKSEDLINGDDRPDSGPEQSQQPQSTPKKATQALTLPPLTGDVPPAIHTAYDVACESTKDQLRQCVQVPKNSSEEVGELIENIRRVTTTKVEKVDTDSLALSGPPEENALALYLVYRYLRQNKS